MRGNMETLFIFIISVVLLNNIYFISFAQETYVIQKATLIIYRDGIVHVEVEASIFNETEPLIIIPLLSSYERINNILVLDENGDLLDYDLNNYNITIYCLGARTITLEYDTDNLTSKEAGLWTLRLKAVFELTVVFPENATIIYLSAAPLAIRTEDNRVKMDLCSGDWEISYEVPIQTPSNLAPSPSTPPPSQPSTQFPLRELIIIVSAVVLAYIIILVFVHVRRKKRLELLRKEEVEVIRFLKEMGGRALEAELRRRFPEIPRTSMWRLIRRLEKQGIVEVRKVGLQNVVELK